MLRINIEIILLHHMYMQSQLLRGGGRCIESVFEGVLKMLCI